MFVRKGELVANAKYLDIVPRAPSWWCPIEQTVTVRIQQVLLPNIQLAANSLSNPLPPMNKTAKQNAIRLGSKKLSKDDRKKILDEILLCSVLDFEERENDRELTVSEDEYSSDDESMSDNE